MTSDLEYEQRIDSILSQIDLSPEHKTILKNTLIRYRKAFETLAKGD